MLASIKFDDEAALQTRKVKNIVSIRMLTAKLASFDLSAFQPIKVLKGTFSAGRFSTVPRKVLVVVQFTVSVTLVSKDAASVTIDTQIVSCSGSGGVFTGTIQTGSGITVVDGGSLTATYPGAIAQANATVSCQLTATDQGSALAGGCDNGAAGTDSISGPLTGAGSNEFYTKYMDAGEYTSYTFRFKNTSGLALTFTAGPPPPR